MVFTVALVYIDVLEYSYLPRSSSEHYYAAVENENKGLLYTVYVVIFPVHSSGKEKQGMTVGYITRDWLVCGPTPGSSL